MTQPKLANVKAQPRSCSGKIRVGSKVQTCGTPLAAGKCRRKDEHLLPMPTGFCNSGWHEGAKVAAPTCKYYLHCPCDCHAQVSMMFELAEKERVLVDNSSWKPERTFVMPDPMAVHTFPSSPGSPNPPRTIESPAPGIVPVPVARVFAPTATGRAARGELELWVREITDIWAVERDASCTPEYISKEIARKKGIKAPSTGAVDAVLKRWEKIGFADIHKKPTRFAGYTEVGIKFGLDFMKAKAKAGK